MTDLEHVAQLVPDVEVLYGVVVGMLREPEMRSALDRVAAALDACRHLTGIEVQELIGK